MTTLKQRGFTLVEIMIVVAIIGLLAAIGVPAMVQAGEKARARRFAHDIERAGHAFIEFSMENGYYPGDMSPAQIPNGMAGYLWNFHWTEDTAVGGQWDWDYLQFGTKAGVSVYMPTWDDDRMVMVDEVLDDGNLATGSFRKRSGGYMYVLEEN